VTDALFSVNWALILNFSGFLFLVVAGVLYMRSQERRLYATEMANLVTTRGERIEDLQAEVTRLSERLAQVEGQIEAVQRLKAQEIALEVSRMLHQEFRMREKYEANEDQT
jgi:hypothetical protein